MEKSAKNESDASLIESELQLTNAENVPLKLHGHESSDSFLVGCISGSNVISS